MIRLSALFALLLIAVQPAHAAPTGVLNDTGQDTCYNDSAADGVAASDPASISRDAGTHPRQDCRFGRDAAAAAGALPKTGAGAKGFDFTKVCMSGELSGTGSCPANPAQGTNPNEWACTKDNVTNLIWSLESGSGNWTYATVTYPAAMNGTTRCGFNSGWRAPTLRELLSIVHNNTWNPAIDTFNFFPGTFSDWYWSADTYAPAPALAWGVGFNDGDTNAYDKSGDNLVRLVRSGQ